jgi:hypothetical protein
MLLINQMLIFHYQIYFFLNVSNLSYANTESQKRIYLVTRLSSQYIIQP